MEAPTGRPLPAAFAAPRRYIQGAGALDQLPEVPGQLGLQRPRRAPTPSSGSAAAR